MNILSIEAVSKQYENHTALKRVSIAVPQGSIYGLLGPNGAGKTTLIRIITQIIAPDEGRIFFNDEPLQSKHTKTIGYLPEERGLYKKMEVGEQLLYFAQLRGLSRIEATQRLKYWMNRFDLMGWWNKKIEVLSKGMQQKVQFIATVIHEPALIILDEPFSGFDPINSSIITDEILRLKQEGATIIFSTHRMETVEQLCNHIALIHRAQKVLEGPIANIRSQYKSFTYQLEYTGSSIQNCNLFSVESQAPKGDVWSATIKINSNVSTNDVLRYLIQNQNITVNGFTEMVPSMHEIFVRVVNDNAG